MKATDAIELFDRLARGVFAIAAAVLMLLALVMIGDAVMQFVMTLRTGKDFGIAALSGIGYVVVSIAVFDVAKYLVEEEVVRSREMRAASETRRSLTRFIATIAIAIFLEALLTVFRVSRDDIPNLVFPTFLLIAAILMVLGLGIYQRLSAIVEQEVGTKDQADEKKKKATSPVP